MEWMKIEEAKLGRDDVSVKFRFVITKKNQSSNTHETQIDFEANMIEDTPYRLAEEMISDLNLPKSRVDAVAALLANEWQRLELEKLNRSKRRLLEKAKRLEDQKRWTEAERYYALLITLLDELDKDCGSEQAIVNRTIRGISLFALCNVYYKLKQYPKAKQCYKGYLQFEQNQEKTDKADKEPPKPKLPTTGSASNTPNASPNVRKPFSPSNSGSLSPSIRDSSEEIAAVAQQETIAGLKTQYGLAKVYRKEEKYAKAEILCKGIINRPVEDRAIEEQEIIEKTRALLSKAYEAQGKFYESENLYKRRWEDLNFLFQTMEKKAEDFIKLAKYQEAQQFFKDALKLKETAVPILEKLTTLYSLHNKYNEAKNAVKICIELKEKLQDPEHYSLAETYCTLAKIFQQQNSYDEAMTIYFKALKIVEKALSSNENLIASLRKQNMKIEVEKTLLRNQEIRRVLIVILNHIAAVLNEQHKPEEAATYTKRITDVQEQGHKLTQEGSSGMNNSSGSLPREKSN